MYIIALGHYSMWKGKKLKYLKHGAEEEL